MNRETRRNVCKNKLISKSDLPTTPSEFPRSPDLCPLPQAATPQPAITTKCYGVSAEAPSPEFSSHSGPSRSKAVGPLSLQSWICEGAPVWRSQVRMEGHQVWLRWKGQMRKTLCAQASRQKTKKRSEPPGDTQGPHGQEQPEGKRWGGGTVAGRPGPAVLHGRGKWGPSEWQGAAGTTAPLRRRTPPAW